MPGQSARITLKDHSPSAVGRFTPKFAVQIVGQSAKHQAARGGGGDEVTEVRELHLVFVGEPRERQYHAEEAAMTGHAAFPHFENPEGIAAEATPAVVEQV